MAINTRSNRAGIFATLGVVAAAALVAACSASGDTATEIPSVATGAVAQAFSSASTRASVPRDLLVAMAKVEDGLTLPAVRDVEEDDSAEDILRAAGPLMLRRGKLDTLARGAELVKASELELRKSSDLALDAGALVLAELGAKTGANSGDLRSWRNAIEEMSGYADDAHREEYAHRVFATLARGGRFEARDGETVVLPRHDLPVGLTVDLSSTLHTTATAQFPGAEWIPTSCNNKCDPGRGGAKVQYIVIHDTEGGWDASVATLQNDPGKSVQYIVGTDGRIGQFVTEDTTAYHAGNYFFNQRSVGIEHVGYSTKPYTEAEYAASAKLVDYLTKKYGVAKDRAHIIGHEQVPNGTRISQSSAPCSTSPKACQSNLNYGGAGHHTDPGVWEWPTFMVRFGGNAKCNDVTEILNCSNDKKKAFRCVGGKVHTCDGPGACQVKASGVDDVCNVAPKTAPPPSDGTSGGPTSPTGPGGSEGAPSETTGAPLPSPAPSDGEGGDVNASADDAGGCALAAGAPGRGGSSGLRAPSPLVLAAAVTSLVLVFRARARRRSSSRTS